MFSLRQLQHLLALAEEKHFARAARRVNLSQPAFSRSVQAIEQQTGLRLFERDTPTIQPTPAGAFLIERARALVFDIRCVQRDVVLYRDAQLGDTAFGAGPFPAATLVPQVLQLWRQQHPQVGLKVEVNNWELLFEHLQREDIEFLVADSRSLQPSVDLEVQPLNRQLAQFHVRSGHPLLGQTPTLQQTWSYGVGAIKVPPAVKLGLAQLLGLPAGAEPPLVLECDDVSLLHHLALCTDTVIATTREAVQRTGAEGRLHALSVANFPGVHAEMGLVWLKKRTLSPAAQALIEIFRRVADAPQPPAAAKSPQRRAQRGT